MRHLSNKVNIVPVIAKADCLTQAEIGALKQKILQEIRDNDIKIYSLPECDRYASLCYAFWTMNHAHTHYGMRACEEILACTCTKYERMLKMSLMKFNLKFREIQFMECSESLSIIRKF